MAQYDFVLRELWPFREVTGTLNTISSTQEYDLSSNFANLDEQNIISITVQGSTNRKLIYWPYNQLRADQPDFDLIGASVPERYYIKSNQLGLWPVPNDVYVIAIDYYKLPTELSDDTDTPIIPIAYRESLVQYALALEHDFNSDPDLSQKAMSRYEQITTLARQNLLVQPNDTENFRLLGPQDFRNHTGIEGETR